MPKTSNPLVKKTKKPVIPIPPKKTAVKNRFATKTASAPADGLAGVAGANAGGNSAGSSYKSWQPKAVARRAYEIKVGLHPISQGKIKKNRGR